MTEITVFNGQRSQSETRLFTGCFFCRQYIVPVQYIRARAQLFLILETIVLWQLLLVPGL